MIASAAESRGTAWDFYAEPTFHPAPGWIEKLVAEHLPAWKRGPHISAPRTRGERRNPSNSRSVFKDYGWLSYQKNWAARDSDNLDWRRRTRSPGG
jgi:hypothetical protein